MHGTPSDPARSGPADPTLADELLIDAEDDPTPRPPAAHPLLLGTALVLVALNLRPALSSVAPVLAELIRDTGVNASLAGTLTTLPVLCLGIFGLAAPWLAQRYGSERVILVTLVGLAAGTGLRMVPSFPSQVAASIVAGAGIGIVGTLLPGIVKRDFPRNPALMTGIYTMGLCAGASLGAGITLPLANALGGSWAAALGAWGVPALVAALAWAALVPRQPPVRRRGAGGPAPSLWRDRLAWQVTLFMGLQSSIAYIVMAWMPVIVRDRGVDPVDAGVVVSVSIMFQVVSSLITPIAATRARQQSLTAVATLGLALAGFLGFLWAPLWTMWGWSVVMGLGQGGMFAIALTIIVLRSPDPHVATRLSGMAQSVGYAIAACGPLVAGLLHDWTGTWAAAGLVTIAITVSAAVFGYAAGRPGYVLSR